MKRIPLTLSALAIGCAAQAASMNIGCFNIRFQTAADTGELDWNNRKEYVARTITEYGYDVLAINEMLVGQQRDDMLAMLPGYTFSGWGCDSATDPYTGTFYSVAFRSDKFDLIDEGHFFLAKDTERPKSSWDCSTNKRMTVWVRLRVKETGEEFYYFATHLDHKGSDARNEGARINLEKIRRITGHYPAFISGDHNSSASRVPFYNLFASYMDDAFKVSATPFPWAKNEDGTLCKWNPDNKDNSRLDYIWVKGADVNSYIHINDTFGRDVTPSDHFAVMANVTLKAYSADHSLYVDAAASEGGDGSKAAPLASLQDAIDRTCSGDTIYVAAGDYAIEPRQSLTGASATINIPHSLTILGGYDSDFAEASGTSRIDGRGEVHRVVTVQPQASLELSHFEIAGGCADGNGADTYGAGIACLGARLDLRHVVVRDNHAKGNGGGVYAAGQLLCSDCRFERNSSELYGGAFYTHYSGEKLWWRFIISGSSFTDNSALQGAAGFIGGFSKAFIGHNTFARNTARQSGTLALAGANYESAVSLVNNTFCNNSVEAAPGIINEIKGGAAVYAKLHNDASIHLINNTITANSTLCGNGLDTPADFRGGAVNIYSGSLTLYANIIGGNSTNAADGFADIVTDGSKVTSRYNAYGHRGGLDFTPNASDITASSAEEACMALAAVFGGTVSPDGTLAVSTVDQGYTFPVLPIADHSYCGSSLNSMPYAIFSESYIKCDVDGNADLTDKLVYDQRGVRKRTDGTASLGAVEHFPGDTGAGNASVSDILEDCRVIDLAGRTVASLGTIRRGQRIVVPGLQRGIYILAWSTGATKIIY